MEDLQKVTTGVLERVGIAQHAIAQDHAAMLAPVSSVLVTMRKRTRFATATTEASNLLLLLHGLFTLLACPALGKFVDLFERSGKE